VKRLIRKQLAFDLEGGLLGREKDQGTAGGTFGQGVTHFREAAECLAAAGRAKKKARMHDLFSRKAAKAQRNLL
jgi:hypothetical protein